MLRITKYSILKNPLLQLLIIYFLSTQDLLEIKIYSPFLEANAKE